MIASTTLDRVHAPSFGADFQPLCPRGHGRLSLDYEDVVCLTCGYSYDSDAVASLVGALRRERVRGRLQELALATSR